MESFEKRSFRRSRVAFRNETLAIQFSEQALEPPRESLYFSRSSWSDASAARSFITSTASTVTFLVPIPSKATVISRFRPPFCGPERDD